jgi:hypothetical protein
MDDSMLASKGLRMSGIGSGTTATLCRGLAFQ